MINIIVENHLLTKFQLHIFNNTVIFTKMNNVQEIILK